MNAATIIAIIVGIGGLGVSLGTIIFKLGVGNRTLVELVAKATSQDIKLAKLDNDMSELKIKLASKIPGIFGG